MNAVIETVIARVLSPYLEGVSRENLRLGLISGNLRLSKLQVKPSLLSELHLHMASFDKAYVESVSVAIPWSNPISGKIVIEVEGVVARVRLSEAADLDKDKMIALRRDAIDAIKSQLTRALLSHAPDPGGSFLLNLTPNSYTAKLIRKIVDSIIVNISNIEVSVILPDAMMVQTDEFEDAQEEIVPDMSLTISRVSVEDRSSDKRTVLGKSFEIIGLAVLHIVPRMDLRVSLDHDLETQSLTVSVTGLDECDISLNSGVLSRLRDMINLINAATSGGNVTPPAEMAPDVVARYSAMYRDYCNLEESDVWTESRRDLKRELDDFTLIFDTQRIAHAESLIDQSIEVEAMKKSEQSQDTSWWSSFWGSEASKDLVAEYEATIRRQIEQSSEIAAPLNITIRVEIGQSWRVRLGDNELLTIQLEGAVISLAITNTPDSVSLKGLFASKGLSVDFHGNPLVSLFGQKSLNRSWTNVSSISSVDSSPRISPTNTERGYPLELEVVYSSVTGGYRELWFQLATDPVRLVYLPGLMEELTSFIKLLKPDPKILKAQVELGQQLLKRLQSSVIKSSVIPNKVGFKLELAGPVIELPCSSSCEDHITLSLGNLVVYQPTTLFDGSADSAKCTALLDKFSLAIDSGGTETRVLSPSPIEIKAYIDSSTRMYHTSVEMNEVLSCRFSPQLWSVFEETFDFLTTEFATLNDTDEEDLETDEDTSCIPNESLTTKLPIESILLDINIRRIDLMVSDGACDLVNVIVAVPDLSVGVSLDSGDLAVSLDKLGIGAKCMNASIGDWEPLMEPARYSVFGHKAGRDLTLSVRSTTGTNFVANPNTVRVITSLVTRLNKTDQYNLINATGYCVYVGFPGKKSSASVIQLLPKDDCVSIDKKVMRSGAREILISLNKQEVIFGLEKSSISTKLITIPLDRLFSGGRLSENVLVHSRVSINEARTVIVSYDSFMLNECDVPIQVRCRDNTDDVVIFSSVSVLPTPDVSLIGGERFSGSSAFDLLKPVVAEPEFLIVNPGNFFSVPAALMDKLEIRPAIGGSRPWTYLLPGTRSSTWWVDCGGNFFLQIHASESGLFDMSVPMVGSAMKVVQVRPPMVVMNSLACPIRVSHYIDNTDQNVFMTVPEYDSVAVYSAKVPSNIRIGFANEETEWSNYIEHGETRHELSVNMRIYQPVHVTSTFNNEHLVVSVKWLLVDRTGLSGVEIYHSESGLKLIQGKCDGSLVYLLPDPDRATTIELIRGRDHWEQALVDSGSVFGYLGLTSLVMISRETLEDKYIELVPRYTFFNSLLDESLFISTRFTGTSLVKSSGASFDLIEPNSGIPLLGNCDGFFQFQLSPNGTVSCAIPLKDTAAGIWPLRVGDNTYCIEISPSDQHCIHVSIKAGSTITVHNRRNSDYVYLMSDGGKIFTISPRSCRNIGWEDPFKNATVSTSMRIGDNNELFTVPLARAGDDQIYGNCVKVVPGTGKQSVDILVMSQKPLNSQLITPLTLTVEIDKLSFSLSRMGKELIYAELSLIRAMAKQIDGGNAMRIACLVSEIQIETAVSRKNEKPVIVANSGEGSRPFIEALVEISTSVSEGVSAISAVDIRFDSLFVEVDSDLAKAMDECLDELIQSDTVISHKPERSKKLIADTLYIIKRGTVRSIPAPSILILDSMFVSKIAIELWVDFSLKSMLFMPASLKLIVGMLSPGKSFRLDGAHVEIRPRHVQAFKGSADEFVQALIRDYAMEGLRNAATLLGNSSLLAIPRAPISFVSDVGARGLERAAGAFTGLVAMLSDLTADSTYKDRQDQIRRNKKIAGIADGFVEGANRLGEGLGGLMDIFKKPVKGAQAGGVAGFMLGIGTGIVGTVIKPVTKLGEALGDVGTGIARSFAPRRIRDRQVRYVRRRIPRCFYGPTRAVGDYRLLDAIVCASRPGLTQDMDIVVPLKEMHALLGFIDRIVIVAMKIERDMSVVSVGSASGGSDEQSGLSIEETASDAPIMEMGIESVLELRVDEIKSVELKEGNSVIINEGDIVLLGENPGVMETVASALSLAIKTDRIDWRDTRRCMSDTLFRSIVSGDQAYESRPNEEETIVEVWEVERFLLAYGWVTPYMLLDTETGWRWVDIHMRKHARVDGRLTRSEAAKSKVPPLAFGELWKPNGEWTVARDDNTDSEGWMYAISFSSSTWQNAPGIAASVRKRKWIRQIA